MKITSYLQVPASRQDHAEPSAKAGLVNFNRMLNRLIQPPRQAPAGGTAWVGEDRAGDINGSQNRLLKRMEKVVGMLEGFRTQMADPATSLKELHPAAQQIENEINALSVSLESLPANGELAQALQKTLTAAAMDLARFRSGAYLSQNSLVARADLAGRV